MDEAMKKRKTIPPYWVDIVVALFFLMLSLFLWNWGISDGDTLSRRTEYGLRFLAGLSILVLVKSCLHWTICEQGIIVRFLLIPIRLIRWDKITMAEYIYNWFTGSSSIKMDGQGIFITLVGCPLFSPEIDGLNMFLLKHPIGSLFIRFTPRKQIEYVELFQLYFPELDFQLGYEKQFQKR